jgi:hypothetical protein
MIATVFLGSFAILTVIFECGARSPSHDARDQLRDVDWRLLDVLNDFHRGSNNPEVQQDHA